MAATGGRDCVGSNVSTTWITVTMAALEMQPVFLPPLLYLPFLTLFLIYHLTTEDVWACTSGVSELFSFLSLPLYIVLNIWRPEKKEACQPGSWWNPEVWEWQEKTGSGRVWLRDELCPPPPLLLSSPSLPPPPLDLVTLLARVTHSRYVSLSQGRYATSTLPLSVSHNLPKKEKKKSAGLAD